MLNLKSVVSPQPADLNPVSVKSGSCSVMSDSATPWAVQAPLSREFFKQECWSRQPFPSPGGLPDPGIIHTQFSCSVCSQSSAKDCALCHYLECAQGAGSRLGKCAGYMHGVLWVPVGQLGRFAYQVFPVACWWACRWSLWTVSMICILLMPSQSYVSPAFPSSSWPSVMQLMILYSRWSKREMSTIGTAYTIGEAMCLLFSSRINHS